MTRQLLDALATRIGWDAVANTGATVTFFEPKGTVESAVLLTVHAAVDPDTLVLHLHHDAMTTTASLADGLTDAVEAFLTLIEDLDYVICTDCEHIRRAHVVCEGNWRCLQCQREHARSCNLCTEGDGE